MLTALALAAILQHLAGLSASAKLTPEQERTIRVMISDYPAGTYTEIVALPELGGAPLPFTRVDMPKDLEAAYAKAPSAVIGLLLRIVDGGTPRDSSSAAVYALTLAGPDGAGLAPIALFDKATYDVVVKGWDTTPRYH